MQVGKALANDGEIAFAVNQKTPEFEIPAVGGRQFCQRLTELIFKGGAVVADRPKRRFDAFQHGKKEVIGTIRFSNAGLLKNCIGKLVEKRATELRFN